MAGRAAGRRLRTKADAGPLPLPILPRRRRGAVANGHDHLECESS